MATFGKNLKHLRRLHNISQQELALRMYTTQQRISEWECDKVEPSLYNIIKILQIFDITFEELTDGISHK